MAVYGGKKGEIGKRKRVKKGKKIVSGHHTPPFFGLAGRVV